MLSTVDSKIILKNTKYLQIVNIVNDHRWNVDVWKKNTYLLKIAVDERNDHYVIHVKQKKTFAMVT